MLCANCSDGSFLFETGAAAESVTSMTIPKNREPLDPNMRDRMMGKDLCAPLGRHA